MCNDAHPGFVLFARVSAYGRKFPRQRNTLGRMGTSSNADARRMPLLRHLHRQLLALRVDIPDEEEDSR